MTYFRWSQERQVESDLNINRKGLRMKCGLILLIALYFGNFEHNILKFTEQKNSLFLKYKLSLSGRMRGVNLKNQLGG